MRKERPFGTEDRKGPGDGRFREVRDLLLHGIQERGVGIVSLEVPDPFRGDLDGESLFLRPGLSEEETVFLLAHLFGHTVQWNLSPRARELGFAVPPIPRELLGELEAYEAEACRYALGLLHEAQVHDLDQWLSDIAACDFAFLKHYYLTGERRPFESFFRPGQPRLPPLDVPDFRPRRWKLRSQGIVL